MADDTGIFPILCHACDEILPETSFTKHQLKIAVQHVLPRCNICAAKGYAVHECELEDCCGPYALYFEEFLRYVYCHACNQYFSQRHFNPIMLAKALERSTKYTRCIDCVTNERKWSACSPKSLCWMCRRNYNEPKCLVCCSTCFQVKLPVNFTDSQMRKIRPVRRCKNCVLQDSYS